MNVTLRSLSIIILLLVLFGLIGCTTHDEKTSQSTSDTSSVSQDSVMPSGQESRQYISTPVSEEMLTDSLEASGLLIGVVTYHGVITPIAQRTASGQWSNPWPEPSYADTTPLPPQAKMPRTWYVYPMDSVGLSIYRVRHAALEQASCGEQWVLKTDQFRRGDPFADWGDMFGVALSKPMQKLTGAELSAQMPELQKTLEKLGLVSNTDDGEGRKRCYPMGYFMIENEPVGVAAIFGYEGQGYQVFKADGDSSAVIIKADGGGC